MRIQGISGSRGVAVGNVYRYIQEEIVIPDYNVAEDKVEEEIGKFATAMASTLKQLDTIRKKEYLRPLGHVSGEGFWAPATGWRPSLPAKTAKRLS